MFMFLVDFERALEQSAHEMDHPPVAIATNGDDPTLVFDLPGERKAWEAAGVDMEVAEFGPYDDPITECRRRDIPVYIRGDQVFAICEANPYTWK